MPDHVRRAVDARLSEAAWREKHHLEREERHDGPVADHGAHAVIADLDHFRTAPARRRRLPVVAAAVALIVGAVGVAALAADRSSPEPVATSVVQPGPTRDAAVEVPPAVEVVPADPEPTPSVPGVAPAIESILAGLPTAGLAPGRLEAALAGIDAPATDAAADLRATTSAVIAGVTCAWLDHWHDAVGESDAAQADRAVSVFADLDRWPALGGPGLGAVTRLVRDVADVVVAAGASPAGADAVVAAVRPRVCDI